MSDLIIPGLDASNVGVATTGMAYSGDEGAARPPSPLGVPGAGFNPLGYAGEDGVTFSIDNTVQNIAAWQGGDVVRKVQTEHDVTFSLTLIETKSPAAIREYAGNYDQISNSYDLTSQQLPAHPWILDVIDENDKYRIWIPSGQVTERGDLEFRNDAAIGYELTITCYPVDGVKATVYLATLASNGSS